MTLKITDKLLIVENDAVLRQGLADYFEDNSFEVIQADNGKVALELFTTEKPDVVLTSLELPVVQGVKVLETLSKEAPNVPVVVSSKPTSMNDVIDALRHGAWDYVAKPYPNFPVVEHVVCKALERARLVEENKRYREQLETTNQALKKNLDILREDQEAGRSVQMRMLPEQDVHFGPYVFSHGISPSLYLSGDFLDYFKINETIMGFYIADVSGHGASSAFVTVFLKSLIALALTKYQMHDDQIILEPDKLLALLAKEVHASKLGKYLTIVYGILDFTTHQLTYSIGGHYPNPAWIEDKKAHFMEGTGFPVGIMNQATYQKHSLIFPKGVHLVMFSDGILEIMEEPDLLTKEKAILEAVATGDTIEHLTKHFKLHEDRVLPDDITMLMIKRTE